MFCGVKIIEKIFKFILDLFQISVIMINVKQHKKQFLKNKKYCLTKYKLYDTLETSQVHNIFSMRLTVFGHSKKIKFTT